MTVRDHFIYSCLCTLHSNDTFGNREVLSGWQHCSRLTRHSPSCILLKTNYYSGWTETKASKFYILRFMKYICILLNIYSRSNSMLHFFIFFHRFFGDKKHSKRSLVTTSRSMSNFVIFFNRRRRRFSAKLLEWVNRRINFLSAYFQPIVIVFFFLTIQKSLWFKFLRLSTSNN